MSLKTLEREPTVAIVVLNYNGLEDTLKCLQSLRELADPARVILVDNASRVDPTVEAAKVYPDLEAVQTGENLGYAGGNNRGIELAIARGADYVLILNNDTVVHRDIVGALVAVFEQNPPLGIVGPVINFMDEPGHVMTDGVTFNPGPGTEFFPRVVVPVSPVDPTLVRVDIVNGCCMMVRAAVFKAVGMFDESFFIIHEESDLCLRARRAGFESAVLGRSLVWHKGSSTFERSGRQLQRYFDTRNLLRLLRRHAGRVGHSRPLLPSVWHFLLYAFYRYDIEREAGKLPAARAVIDGLYDGLRGRSGPYATRARPGVGALRGLLGAARSVARARRRVRPLKPGA